MKPWTDVSPMHMTYFMMNWDEVKQIPSDQECSQCGRIMNLVEPPLSYKGQKYDGYVCHTDKRVFWVKAG